MTAIPVLMSNGKNASPIVDDPRFQVLDFWLEAWRSAVPFFFHHLD